MNRPILLVTAVNIAALIFCAAALIVLANQPEVMVKALLMAQVPMLLMALAGLSWSHGEWLRLRQERRNTFAPLPIKERVRHASWLASLPQFVRQGH